MAKAQILVVEDESIIAKDIENTLKGLGYAVSAAVSSGEEAIREAEERHPDLVLMDIILKGDMDGVEAAEQIRDCLNIPIVYLTAHADEDTLRRAKVTAPFGYILKPFNEKELNTTIEMSLYRYEMERRLKESEQWFATTLKSIGEGVIATDEKGRLRFMNPAAQALTGWKQIAALGKDLTEIFNIINEETRTFAESPVAKILREGLVTGLANHTILIARNGTEIPIDSSAAPIRDDKGNITGAVLVFRDISERKRAEVILRESDECFHQIFQQSEDALMIFKFGTCVLIDANPAAVNLFGYVKEVLIEHGPSLFTEPSEYQKFKQIIYNTDKREGFHIKQKALIRKDGAKITCTIRGKIIRLQENDVLYCSFRDITEKIRLEEETRLIQAKLIHANKMTALGTLVSGVAHEINNPNNFIMVNASLVSEAWQDAIKILKEYYRENGEFSLGGLPFSEMSEVIPKLFSRIADGSSRIKNIVDNLMDFARKDKSGLDGRINVNEVIMATTSILSNQVIKYTENLHLEYEKNLPIIKGSAQQLEQVIINLITNSLQALPNKKCGIWVSTSFNKELGCVVIQVKDEGVGMSTEVLEQIFEPFFTTRLSTGGTGLGLFIAFSIIQGHQGSLEFKSEPGKGTTVTIKLPTG